MSKFLAQWRALASLVDMVNEQQPPGFKLTLFFFYCLAYMEIEIAKHKSKTQ